MPVADTSKLQGEQAELHFALQASLNGLVISKPLGDSQKYDFITDDNGRLCRVQVKSGSYFDTKSRRYIVNCLSGGRTRRGKYGPQDCDFVAVYLAPLDDWYILPVERVMTTSVISIKPGGPFKEFQEAWHLLKYA